MKSIAGNLPLDLDHISIPDSISSRIHIKDQWKIYLAILVIFDALMLAAGFWLAYQVRFSLNIKIFQLDVNPSAQFYARVVLMMLPLWIVVYALNGMYERRNLLGGTEEYARVTHGTVYGIMLMIVAGFLEPTFVIARGWLLIAGTFVTFFTLVERFTFRHLVYHLRRRGLFCAATVIVGANDEGLSLATQLAGSRTSGMRIVGLVDKKVPAGTKLAGRFTVLGKVEQLDEIIHRYKVTELILASSAISVRDRLLEIFQKYGVGEGVNVRLSSGMYEIITTGLTVHEIGCVPLVTINDLRLKRFDLIVKRTLDLLIAVPGLLVLSLWLGLIALLVHLDSPGPIVYRRRVMGVRGRQFDALKFRTMYVNSDEIFDEILKAKPELAKEFEENFKLKDDPRITKLGKILRKYSLDELPQLINVAKGDMSLVGPRMITPKEMVFYEELGVNLLTVRPGITGLWQVSGRSDLTYEDRVRLDMHYIRNWSIWEDLRLLWQTVPAILTGKGAY